MDETDILYMKMEAINMWLPIHWVINLFIMAPYTCEKLVATRSKKLAIPLVVFATKDPLLRISIRWMLTRNYFHIVWDTGWFKIMYPLCGNPTAEKVLLEEETKKSSLPFLEPSHHFIISINTHFPLPNTSLTLYPTFFNRPWLLSPANTPVSNFTSFYLSVIRLSAVCTMPRFFCVKVSISSSFVMWVLGLSVEVYYITHSVALNISYNSVMLLTWSLNLLFFFFCILWYLRGFW